MKVDKYYNEKGQVAIIYSPSFGAGWSTWNECSEDLIFDSRIVEELLKGNTITVKFMESIGYANIYISHYLINDDLQIMWLEPGHKFYVQEYDGSENIISNDLRIYTA